MPNEACSFVLIKYDKLSNESESVAGMLKLPKLKSHTSFIFSMPYREIATMFLSCVCIQSLLSSLCFELRRIATIIANLGLTHRTAQ